MKAAFVKVNDFDVWFNDKLRKLHGELEALVLQLIQVFIERKKLWLCDVVPEAIAFVELSQSFSWNVNVIKLLYFGTALENAEVNPRFKALFAQESFLD